MGQAVTCGRSVNQTNLLRVLPRVPRAPIPVRGDLRIRLFCELVVPMKYDPQQQATSKSNPNLFSSIPMSREIQDCFGRGMVVDVGLQSVFQSAIGSVCDAKTEIRTPAPSPVPDSHLE